MDETLTECKNRAGGHCHQYPFWTWASGIPALALKSSCSGPPVAGLFSTRWGLCRAQEGVCSMTAPAHSFLNRVPRTGTQNCLCQHPCQYLKRSLLLVHILKESLPCRCVPSGQSSVERGWESHRTWPWCADQACQSHASETSYSARGTDLRKARSYSCPGPWKC